MTFRIEPPLEPRHKAGIFLMVLAAMAAAILINLAIERIGDRSAREWAERQEARREQR